MLLSPTVHASDNDHALGSYDRLFLILWRKRTLAEHLRPCAEQVRALAQAHGGKVGFLTVVEEAAPLPPAEARKAIADFFALTAPVVQASALAFEGSGFRAAAVRSVVTGIALLVPNPFPHVVFPTLREAAGWLVPQLQALGSTALSAETAVQAMEALRRSGPRAASAR